jgi:hypothetical protein
MAEARFHAFLVLAGNDLDCGRVNGLRLGATFKLMRKFDQL